MPLINLQSPEELTPMKKKRLCLFFSHPGYSRVGGCSLMLPNMVKTAELDGPTAQQP